MNLFSMPVWVCLFSFGSSLFECPFQFFTTCWCYCLVCQPQMTLAFISVVVDIRFLAFVCFHFGIFFFGYFQSYNFHFSILFLRRKFVSNFPVQFPSIFAIVFVLCIVALFLT